MLPKMFLIFLDCAWNLGARLHGVEAPALNIFPKPLISDKKASMVNSENQIEYSPKSIIEQLIEYMIKTIEDKIIDIIDFILYERE